MPDSTRLDLLETSELTALICVDSTELQNVLIEHASTLNYRCQTGISPIDLALKLRTHTYDLLIIDERLGSSTLATNIVYQEAISSPAANRHRQFIVLIGADFVTGDENQSFAHSVDLVLALNQVGHLRPLLRRALVRNREFYASYREALRSIGAE